jgi:hypothetical protein
MPSPTPAEPTSALPLARRQGDTLFELRAAVDDYELRGQPARAALIDAASRIPAASTWPEPRPGQPLGGFPTNLGRDPVAPETRSDPVEEIPHVSNRYPLPAGEIL